MFPVLLLALAAQAPPTPQAADASSLTVSPARAIVEIDAGKLRGQPAALAWSPDGQQVYLQTIETDRWMNRRATHYLLGLDGKPAVRIDGEPDWVASYWAWKSGFFAPRDPSFRVEVESRQELAKSTNTPRGGDIAGMGGVPATSPGQGVPQEVAVGAAMQSQRVTIVTMRLKGQVLGEWVNTQPEPGRTFGWAPAPLGMIAFAKRDRGQLVLMDREGRKQEIADSKDCLLPAWSEDGKHIVYLQRKDKKKFSLMLVDVSP
jgi:hypothetical protein